MGRRLRLMKLHFLVKEVATEKGFSRTKLARKSDTTYATINALWTNKHHDAMVITLLRIAKTLQCSADELYTVIDDEQ